VQTSLYIITYRVSGTFIEIRHMLKQWCQLLMIC